MLFTINHAFLARHTSECTSSTQLDNGQQNPNSFTERIVFNGEWFDPQLMATKKINQYYDATAIRGARADLAFAVSLLPQNEDNVHVAIDCGCGAGADIAYLRQHGFGVYAYDVEEEAIARCTQRFNDDVEVSLTQASFNTFNYPVASLVYADASLFFCPKPDFDEVVAKIKDCLVVGGVFAASFLGRRDTMATPEFEQDAFWSDVLTTDEAELKAKFSDYEMMRFTEHESDGLTAEGKPHHWHIYSMVMRKVDR